MDKRKRCKWKDMFSLKKYFGRIPERTGSQNNEMPAALVAERKLAGFTLIEMLIVIIILGLLMSLVAPRMFGKVDKAKIQTAKAQIELFGSALDTYRLDMGSYPASLQELRSNPNDPRWDGPYLPREIPLDPWNNAYVYTCPGEHGPYDIISYGADGKQGGEGNDKDIVSWE